MLRSSVIQKILLLLAGVALNAAGFGKDLSGTWLVVPKSPEGIARWRIFTFSKSGDVLSGTASSLPAIDGGITFKRINVQNDAVRLEADDSGKWQGKFTDDNELHLIWSPETGDWLPEEMTLRKLSAEQLTTLKKQISKNYTPYTRLPSPPPHDVPSNGLAPTPIMGWNSWNDFASAVDDKAIRAAADALVSTGLRDVGYVYINIDDGWQGSRGPNGEIRPNAKFPDMKGLADYVHAKGLKFGIYSSPGPFTCANYVGSLGHEAQDAETFAAWGVDLLKYDWCSAGEVYSTQDDMRGRYQIMGDALQATGRPIVYSLCQYGLFDVEHWGHSVGGNLWRISSDSIIVQRWTAVSLRFDIHGDPQYSGPGGWNDPDMLLIGNGGLDEKEYRTHLTLWVMLAAPLILGNDLRKMTPGIREMLLNRDVITVDQDPLGQQGRRIRKEGSMEVWSKPLVNHEIAVALFNRGATEQTIQVKWSDLGLSGDSRIRDLWKKKDLRGIESTYRATIPPHGSVLLRVSGT